MTADGIIAAVLLDLKNDAVANAAACVIQHFIFLLLRQAVLTQGKAFNHVTGYKMPRMRIGTYVATDADLARCFRL